MIMMLQCLGNGAMQVIPLLIQYTKLVKLKDARLIYSFMNDYQPHSCEQMQINPDMQMYIIYVTMYIV